MISLSTLNENQLKAVNWNDGPLLVLAGPGSGKTRVLTFRIARLIESSPDKHFKVLGLTFTNIAAVEMRERIAALVPVSGERTLLTTFHSFCADLLRQHGHHLGLKPDFTILSQPADREAVLDEAINAARSDNADIDYTSQRLMPLITRLLDYNVAGNRAADVLQEQNVKRAGQIGQIYQLYRRRMIESNELDFGGLIAEALCLLEERPAVRNQVHRIYRYLCVDEFQDTNLSQYRVLKYLVNPETKNLFVVADDDQIIYQWNGANPERLKALRNDFNMTVLQLPENYRCPPDVIEISNKLIRHNLGRAVEKVNSLAHKHKGGRASIEVKAFPNFDDEADWVASDIGSRPKESWKKCVVLARTRKLLEQVLEALERHQVPGHLAMRKNEFVCPEIAWLHGMLRLANARQDREQLRRICKSFFALEGIDLNVQDIISAAAAEEGDYLRAWLRAALQRGQLSLSTRSFLESSVSRLADRLEFWGFIDESFKWFEELPEIGPASADLGADFEEEKATWCSLVDEVVSQYGREQVTLNVLLQELDLRSKTPTPPRDSVPCFTIHASKGMEFDHVYVVGLVEDQLPSWAAVKKGDDSREMQEERRNCYVAITRAQESLTLTYANRVFGWVKAPSRFLKEMELVA